LQYDNLHSHESQCTSNPEYITECAFCDEDVVQNQLELHLANCVPYLVDKICKLEESNQKLATLNEILREKVTELRGQLKTRGAEFEAEESRAHKQLILKDREIRRISEENQKLRMQLEQAESPATYSEEELLIPNQRRSLFQRFKDFRRTWTRYTAEKEGF